jgi:Ca2+-binding RTX toxin-like protein
VYGKLASINNTGLISAFSSAVILTSEATVSNSGTILSADDAGILAQAGLTLTLTNSGKISGERGIYSTGTTAITNTGVIESTAADGPSAFAIELVDGGNDSIVNRGLIDGNVNLGGGNDLFDTRGGTVLGLVTGGLGNDTFFVSSTDVALFENGGSGTDLVYSSVSWTLGANFENLTLIGNAGINARGNSAGNLIRGNEGDNRLHGGGGADTMLGGDGDDTFITDGSDTITENADEGTDTVRSSVSITLTEHVENLVLTGSDAISGTGNAEDNTITGNRGANQLVGGAGGDTLVGGRGNDVYTIDAEDVVVETAGGGTDTVRADFSTTLGENVENLQLIGTGAISGIGNAAGNVMSGNNGNNRLEGDGGNDLLNGAAGTDTLVGGTGNDSYITDGGDTIFERADEGIDSVQSSATHSLSGNVEHLLLTGSAAINGTGNSLSNIISGNSAANTIDGGAGNDVLTGGGGADAFLFKAALIPANADRINDFDVPADTIQLENAVFTGLAAGTLSAAAFVKNTSGNAADASDRIIYESDTGKLFFDSDGTGAAAKVHFATLGTGLGLTAADFFVV